MIVEQVREAVRRGGLLLPTHPNELPTHPVVAMLSGGRDSVCLLDVAVALRGEGSVRALHVNYGLRGAESDADERHCAALCEQLGVELEIVRVSRRQGETGNLQAWARDVRYTAAIELAEQRRRDSSRPGTRRAIRSRRSSTGSRPRRGAARCWGCGPRRGDWCARCSASHGNRRGRTAKRGDCSWREDESNDI